MIAGLSPFNCNTGGVVEESVEDDAAAPALDDGGVELPVPLAPAPDQLAAARRAQ
jgi:hypothetical protein